MMCTISNIILYIINIMFEINNKTNCMKKQYVIKALGVLVCLTGAFLMWEGSILGEYTTGIATVLSIIGIGMISSYKSYE